MGLSLETLKGMTPTDQLKAVAAGLQGIDNASVRSTIAMQLLGRSGGELVPLLRGMGVELDVARRQLGSAPMIIDKTAAALDTIGDNFGAIGEKGKEFALGVLSKIAPALASITTSIAEIDAAGLGVVVSRYIRDFGQWASASLGVSSSIDNIKKAIQGIKEGNFSDSIKALVMTGRDLAMGAINEVARVGVSAAAAMGETFAYIFRENGPMVKSAEAFFDYITARMAQVSADLYKEMMPGFIRKMNPMEGFFLGHAEGKKAESLSSLGASIGAAGSDIASEASMFGRRFSRNMGATGDIFNMDGRRAETAAMAQKASGTTIEGLREQFDELMREPRNAMRDAEEAKLIDRIRDMTRAGATPQAIKDIEAGKPSGNDTSASETTLQKAVAALESLNNKLPMPALV
jgi:hypothetical protein